MTGPVGPEYGFGLYVHWPYCARICPYCDFNVYAAKDRDTAPLVEAICEDIRAHRALLPDHPPLDSVFLGGGTPSLLMPAELGTILDTANQAFGLQTGAEITLEANPNDVLRSDLGSWRAAGINRLSVGVQSLHDDALAFLGRDHDGASAIQAAEKAISAFENVSIDLIYARPGQSIGDWEDELNAILALSAPHLSLYELTIEERTAFGRRAARGDLVPMSDDDQADLFEVTQDNCAARGLHAYEISNHAAAAQYESRHNHIYWASGDWIGVGPGAHGRITLDGCRRATTARRRPAAYLDHQTGPRWQEDEPLSSLATAREVLTMGLRTGRGVDLRRLDALGHPANQGFIADVAEQGLVQRTGDQMRLAPKGRLLADRISAGLAP